MDATGTKGGPARRRRRNLSAGSAGVPAVRRQQARYAVLFVAPAMLVYLAFMIYLSFTNWNGIAPQKEWVGLANYVRIAGEGAALKAFVNNIVWVIIGTISPVVVGLFEALLVWSG